MNRELVSPDAASSVVVVISILLAIAGAALGFRTAGARGLLFALVGPLVFGLWIGHVALQERFGMDSLVLLIGETVIFVALGVLLGLGWTRLTAAHTKD